MGESMCDVELLRKYLASRLRGDLTQMSIHNRTGMNY